MGLRLHVPEAHRIATLNTVCVPKGVDEAKVRKRLLEGPGIEIAGGFGPLKGKIWRVGLMGYSSQNTNVLLFLAALEKVLLDQGLRVPAGAGVAAAIRSYQHAGQGAVATARK